MRRATPITAGKMRCQSGDSIGVRQRLNGQGLLYIYCSTYIVDQFTGKGFQTYWRDNMVEMVADLPSKSEKPCWGQPPGWPPQTAAAGVFKLKRGIMAKDLKRNGRLKKGYRFAKGGSVVKSKRAEIGRLYELLQLVWGENRKLGSHRISCRLTPLRYSRHGGTSEPKH